MKKKILLMILIITGTNVFAAEICQLKGGGFLDDLLAKYFTASGAWATYLLPTAQQMYGFWFACEFLYQLTFKKVLANDVQKLWYFMVVRIFTGYVFFTIFVDPAFYVGVIQFFVNLGSGAGGFTVTPTSGNPFGALSPSSVMSTGSCMWNSAYTLISGANTDATGLVSGKVAGLPDLKSIFTIGMPVVAMGIGMYILAAIMAVTLFMTALEAYIIMNAGVVLLGFAGSSWTMGFWNKYLSYVGGIAIRLFVMCLILGLVKDTIVSDLTSLNTAIKAIGPGASLSTMGNLVGQELRMLIDMIICTFLVIKVPAMAGSMLTGTVNSGLGDVIAGASMVMAGAGLAAGLGKMGINIGSGGSSSSGGGAKEAFKDSLRGSGGGGLPSGSGSSGSSSDGNRTASQTSKNATAQESKASAMRDQVGLNKPSGSNGNSSPNSGSSSTSSSSNFDSNSSSGSNASNGSGSSASLASPSSSSGKSSDSGSTPTSNSSGSLGNNPSRPGSTTSSSSGNSAPSTSSGSKGSTTSSPTNKTSNSGSSTPLESGSSNNPSNYNGGGISGNQALGTSSGGNNSNLDTDKAKKLKESIKQNQGSFRKNLDKLNQDTHSGAAEINISPHKE